MALSMLMVRAGWKLALPSGPPFGYTLIMSDVNNSGPPKKRGRPATGRDPHLSVRVPQDLLDGVDAFASSSGLSKPEALRRILSDWLKERGYLPK